MHISVKGLQPLETSANAEVHQAGMSRLKKIRLILPHA